MYGPEIGSLITAIVAALGALTVFLRSRTTNKRVSALEKAVPPQKE